MALSRSVRVELTDVERISLGEVAAELQTTILKLQGDRKEVARDIKGAKKQLDETLMALGLGYRTEDRLFEWRINPETRLAELIDSVTGEVEEVRDAYPHELQPDGAADKTEQALAPLPESPVQLSFPFVPPEPAQS